MGGLTLCARRLQCIDLPAIWPDVPLANVLVMPLTKTRAQWVEAQGKMVRTLFPDVNGDNYPDILHVGARGTSMIPFVLVNKGRDEYALITDAYDSVNGNSQTFAYSPFARVFDYSGDGRDDLVLQVGGACANAADGTWYVVFESVLLGEKAKVAPDAPDKGASSFRPLPWPFITPKVMNLIRGKTKKEQNFQGCGFVPIWVEDDTHDKPYLLT